MNIGMLWFDNDTKSELTVRVERAAAYYRSKYGKTPNLCFVHPSMLAGDSASASSKAGEKSALAAGVEVRSNRSVLPNHFWIGVNSAPEVR